MVPTHFSLIPRKRVLYGSGSRVVQIWARGSKIPPKILVRVVVGDQTIERPITNPKEKFQPAGWWRYLLRIYLYADPHDPDLPRSARRSVTGRPVFRQRSTTEVENHILASSRLRVIGPDATEDAGFIVTTVPYTKYPILLGGAKCPLKCIAEFRILPPGSWSGPIESALMEIPSGLRSKGYFLGGRGVGVLRGWSGEDDDSHRPRIYISRVLPTYSLWPFPEDYNSWIDIDMRSLIRG